MLLCKCGCGEKIVIRKWHKWCGIPKFIRGHHARVFSKETRQKISKARKGRSHMEETKRKISMANKGFKHSKEFRKKKSEFMKGNRIALGCRRTEETKTKISIAQRGKSFSEQTRRKLSKACKGRIVSEETRRKIRGKNNSQWLGGISFYPYSSTFNDSLKEKIRERDGNVCQLCNKNEIENKRRLTAHHINYIKNDSKKDNLITLCTSCNNKVNYNRGFWTGFFTCYLVFRNKTIY